MTLGEEGTQQFTVETCVDDKTVKVEAVHDPFITTTVMVGFTRWERFRNLFRTSRTKVQVILRGSEGVERAIMALDPEQLGRDSREILEHRREHKLRVVHYPSFTRITNEPMRANAGHQQLPLDQMPIPEGWRKVAFREPVFGDYFMSSDGGIGYQDGGVHFEGRQAEHIIVAGTGAG